MNIEEWGNKSLMQWILSKESEQPLYRQLISLIEESIEKGLLSAGERLPSERQLAALLKLNRSTIIQAFDHLADRGIIIRKRGSGTYINDDKWELQSTPLIHWIPSTRIPQQSTDQYDLKADQLRQHSDHHSGQPLFNLLDLASDELPPQLLPNITLPDLSFNQLFIEERGSQEAQLGLNQLKKSVQNDLKHRFSMEVEEEQILITSGAQQAIFLITQGLLRPGDALGIEAPSYFYALPLFQAAGLRLYPIPSDSEGITIDGLAKLRQRTQLKMIFINPIFQNPTGSVMTPRRKRELLNYANLHQLIIVEDDAYSALSFNQTIDISPLKKLDHNEQSLYIGSLSNYIGKNIRIGWLIAPKAIVTQLAEIRQQLDSGLSLLPQLVAHFYLEHYHESHINDLQKKLKERASSLIRWLTKKYGDQLIFNTPKGGYYLYATVKEQSYSQLQQILNDLLEQKIIVARGEEFGDTPYHLRFNFAHFELKL